MLNQVVLIGKIIKLPLDIENAEKEYNTLMVIEAERGFKDSNGEYQYDEFTVKMWKGLAAQTKDYCEVGDIVGIKGRLENEAFVDENHQLIYPSVIIAENMTFLSKRK